MGAMITVRNVKAPVLFFSRREMAACLVGATGFFVGRVVVFQIVNPLALPFLASFMGVGLGGKAFYVSAVFLALGLATRLADIFVLRYILAIGLLCVCQFGSQRWLFPNMRGRGGLWELYVQAVMAGSCVLVAGLGVALFIGGSGFLLAVALMESVLAASLVLIVKRATVILTAQRRRNIISGEDMIALSLVLGAVIAGASDIYVGGMSLRFFLCLYVLFVVSFKGGPAMGASTGMLLGLMLHLVGFWAVSMAVVLGLGGMGGGFMKKYGRPQVMAGVLAIGLAAMYMLAAYQLSFALVYAAIAAGLLFMLTPQGFHFNMVSAVNPGFDTASEYIDKIKEETIHRLGAFASAFEKLGITFSGLSVPAKTTLNKKDVAHLIDDLAARACQSCEHHKDCWEENFYDTYRMVFGLLGVCGRKGVVSLEDADRDFYCRQPESFLHHLNMIFALYKQNLLWDMRIAESRELVSQQLVGVSGIMRRLAGEIDLSLRFHEGLEEEMISALLRNKIEVDSVLVLEDKATEGSGRYQVTVNHPHCRGKRLCTAAVLPAISAVLKRKMQPESETGDNCRSGPTTKSCSLRFVEQKKFRIHCGVAHRAKSGRSGTDSGDSYSHIELKGGQSLLVLSDGMGSGHRARRESTATVELLEDFLESGFDKELAVKMINSVLVLKSNEESFSTLDICAIDLYTGEGEFIKIGAWSSFLLRNKKASLIPSSSLPMGMLKQVDFESTHRRLQHEDIILMVTDGVAEAAEGIANREAWLATTLEKCRARNPQDIADAILKAAENSSGGLPKDDMTVLVARVWDRG